MGEGVGKAPSRPSASISCVTSPSPVSSQSLVLHLSRGIKTPVQNNSQNCYEMMSTNMYLGKDNASTVNMLKITQSSTWNLLGNKVS